MGVLGLRVGCSDGVYVGRNVVGIMVLGTTELGIADGLEVLMLGTRELGDCDGTRDGTIVVGFDDGFEDGGNEVGFTVLGG